MKKVIDSVYEYVCGADDPELCRKRIDSVLDFMIRLRHSYVDNDKPQSVMDVNQEIMDIALSNGLRVDYVELE